MNVYRLADRLGKSVSEVMTWPAEEMSYWAAYLKILGQEQKAAAEKARLEAKARRH